MSYRPLAHIVPHLPRVARRGNLITHKPFILITDRERRHARPPYDHSDKTDHHLKIFVVLSELGLTFDDVVLLWNRCAHLDEIEEAVLMTRSRDFGLTRPLAEAVLEVVETDPNPAGAALEYIVVAKLPRALAEVRALA